MKFVSLLSSGIDSPVATYLLSKKADEIIFLHADGRPFTDDREIENFISLTRHLQKIMPCNVKAYIVPHGNALLNYKENCNSRYTCVFCKRIMLHYAEKIAEKEGCWAIIMGDSLGQVASQTLQNIKTIDQSVSIPILRPLIGFDKEDIVKIAKDIGTYDLSILPSQSCQAVPDKPATMAKIENVLDEEIKIDLQEIVKEAIKNTKSINFE